MRSQFGNPGSADRSDKNRLIILGGLFCLLLAATLGVMFILSGSSRASVKPLVVEKEIDVKMVDVLVPLKSIEPGQALDPSSFRKESRPAVGLPSRVVRDFEEIKGLYSRSLIVEGQPLHRDFVTNVRPSSPVTSKIKDGQRAVTIYTDVQSAGEGWVRPGSRVDVVWIYKLQGQPALSVIVQNAEVLSADRQIDSKSGGSFGTVPATVTLLVSSDDANRIQLAQSTGKLTLNLRGDADSGKGDRAASSVVDLSSLVGRGSEQAQSPSVSGPRISVRDPKTGKVEDFVWKDGKLSPH
ncbi:MAG: Flp pilus assembly protein CpaB [Proteobacteria bacterium]|nr:Flp pilus assembly protein CpaB [Pseudomonadota bacterium]